MKKLLAVALALAMVLSLAACTSYVDVDGQPVDAQNGEVAFQWEGEFTVSKVEKADYYVSSVGRHEMSFTAILKSAGYDVLVEIEPEQYVLWDSGTVVRGQIIAQYRHGYSKPVAKISIDEDTFDVLWYGEKS